MFSRNVLCALLAGAQQFGAAFAQVRASTASPASPPRPSSAATVTTAPVPTAPITNATAGIPSDTGVTMAANSTAPDVYLNVPQLSVGRIELDVENLSADINLAANVASLVSINAGVQISIQKVNLTIADVSAELELVVRLGHLVDIVNRVFASLDLNPLLITAINDVTNLVDTVVGAVDGLLGSITQGGTTLSFLIDNLGNIVQEVAGAGGAVTSSIVGNYLTNMTFTGVEQTLQNGLIQKTYSYSPLNALVNIVFNSLGQVVQATVVKNGSGGTSTTTGAGGATTASSSAAAASSAAKKMI